MHVPKLIINCCNKNSSSTSNANTDWVSLTLETSDTLVILSRHHRTHPAAELRDATTNNRIDNVLFLKEKRGQDAMRGAIPTENIPMLA